MLITLMARTARPVAVAGCALLIAACSSGSAAPAKRDVAVPVVTAIVEQQKVPIVLQVVGTVESTGAVTLQSRVDGQIVKVFARDGQEVRAGEPIMQIDPAPFELQVRMAQATLARDEALLENARAKANHGAQLEAQRFISPDDYTQLKTDLDTAIATVDQDRAALDNARLQLSYSTITAPVAGKIGHIAQQVGNFIRASNQTPLTTLNVLDPVDVAFSLPEQQLAPVRAILSQNHDALKVNASALGDANPNIGALTFIDNAADPTTGTIRLRARFDNPSRTLWPGQLVDVSMHLPAPADALVIPEAAVGENARGNYVFVVKNDATAEQRAIKVLRTTSDLAVVTGVTAGETIVVDGQSRLTPHAHVRIANDKAST